MQLKIRSDLFLHYGTQAKNIQEDAELFIIPDEKMVTLSMKRKRTQEVGSSSKKIHSPDIKTRISQNECSRYSSGNRQHFGIIMNG